MKREVLALWRMFVLAAFVPALAFSLAACEPENGGGTGTGGEEDGTEDTTSEIAVTGLVDKFGFTYADISGYANLNLLPAGSGNPVIGVEVVEAKAETETNENAIQSTSGSLIGNIFTASFSNLSHATKYKYRSFVTYGGITYYGNKYNTFTTKEVVNVTSTGEASEIKAGYVVLSASVQTEGVDARDNVYVGLAWSTTKEAICVDGNFESRKTSVQHVEDGVFSATLSGLSGSTTYYYASFTLVGDVYVFSSVKSFTTEDIPEGAVDLGLSVYWASCNVGAESPEEYGDYFAWGETSPKSSYTESNSATYGLSNSELYSRGIIDADCYLTAEYDAATANWGGSWRMPTLDEMKELRSNCTWSSTTQNGVKGYKVTAPNGNSIFLPAAGYRDFTSLYYAGFYGGFWSAAPSGGGYDAFGLYFDLGGYDWHSRSYGFSVRPVSEK